MSNDLIGGNTASGRVAQGGGVMVTAGIVAQSGSIIIGNYPTNCEPPGSVPGCHG